MFIKFDIFDNKKMKRGSARIFFDWVQKTWTVHDDPGIVWQSICLSKTGTFELKDWGVMWMWDKQRNIFILWAAPTSVNDLFAPAAQGAIFDPIDPGFKDGRIAWSIDFTASMNAPAQPPAPVDPPKSAFRMHLLQRLNTLLPAPYPGKNNTTLTGGIGPDNKPPGYTSCGSMPGFVSMEMGTFKGKKGQAHMDYMKRYSLNGTNRVRQMGVRHNCWRENDLIQRPIPGDVYALLDKGLTDKKASGIAHVGVIESAVGDKWVTMDLGQGAGYDGKKVERHYKEAEGELWGETNQGGGYRVLAGWVNVDDYLMLG